nr:hypothetical protein [Tanacetum cinerariifolium]
MMVTNDKESSVAGTDIRPPMLEESDFDSWKISVERYIRGKPQGKIIWKSITDGPSPHPMITVTTGEGEQQTQVIREKTDEEFTEAKNNKERTDIQAIHILSQETLFNQYEMFWINGNESIHDYFVRLHKLTNDLKITDTKILTHQRNTKFLNNLPSYWGKYVTIVKNNKDISTASCVSLYTHLKSYEQHAIKTLSKMNQTFGNADPLAYMAHATKSTSSPSQYVPPLPQLKPFWQMCSVQFRLEPLVITTTTVLEVSQQMHQGEQLNSNVDSDVDDDDNTIPYHQYQSNNKVESDPTDVSSVIPDGIFMITILDDLRIKHNSLRDENVSIKKRYQDLSMAKASNSNVSSGAVIPKKPKVLAPGLYAMTLKYVPP